MGKHTICTNDSFWDISKQVLGEAAVQAALIMTELQLRQGAVREARASAQEALRITTVGGWRREEMLAHCLVGQCMLVQGISTDAQGHLRRALAMQVEIGVDLDAARTGLILAEALVVAGGTGGTLDEACQLLAEAQAQFATSGASLDLARAEHLAVKIGAKKP